MYLEDLYDSILLAELLKCNCMQPGERERLLVQVTSNSKVLIDVHFVLFVCKFLLVKCQKLVKPLSRINTCWKCPQ